jgi:SAM (Sterile alpha motif) domain-containing protein/adenylate/guanylate cyclase family protein
MSEIRNWLESIGLGQYGGSFEVNEIDMDLLGQVDDQILRDIGVSAAGHRLRIRNAIAKLASAPVAEVNLSPTSPKHKTTAAFAERRQLTVMFCDLVGSTALPTRLDPEDLPNIIAAYHRCCTELVERNGGFVAKYRGDGVLAYFVYPQAHQHDAESAVRAGLALVEAVPKLLTNVGPPLQVRVWGRDGAGAHRGRRLARPPWLGPLWVKSAKRRSSQAHSENGPGSQDGRHRPIARRSVRGARAGLGCSMAFSDETPEPVTF